MFAPRDPDEYLLDTERRVIRIRRHWSCLIWDTFEAVALIAVCVMVSYILPVAMWMLQNVLWYVALFLVLRFAYKVIEWWVERLVVTDKRFVMTKGVWTTQVLMMPITKVTDLTYERPFLGRILGYGTMVVESAGQIQALNKIEYLPKPEAFYDTISHLVFGDKQKQAEKFSMIKAQRAARRGRKMVG
ncbi:PH domain-containing protein [Saccharomonospora iraqiensis]|uniref:PH domain-containing protein n=1 Tax=Saccharomonospora iraqiensis TaxID=52698 RepID=UPI00022E11E9|nr:PH domain-containing protein [Saccharomonospora iraqiensis]